MSSTRDLDPAAMARLRKLGGQKFAAEMIRLFVSYVGEKLAEARSAEQSGNLAGVERAVHPIKSSAGNVGAVRIQALAAEAEQQAKQLQAQVVSGLLDQLETAYQAVVPLLEAEMQGPDSLEDTGN